MGTLLSAFARARNGTGAIAWLLRAEEVGVEPDLNCYKQVIQALGTFTRPFGWR